MAKVGNQEVKILSDVQLLVALVVPFIAIRLEFFSNRMNLIKNISKHVAKSPRSFCCFGFASSAQQVPEPDPLPGISLDTRPDPIQF